MSLDILCLIESYTLYISKDWKKYSLNGNLKHLKWLYENKYLELKSSKFYKKPVMDWAAMNGHLKVIQYLHSIGKDCTSCAIDWATRNGHIDVVKFLLDFDKPYTEYATFWAFKFGHLNILQLLNQKKIDFPDN